MIYVGTDSGISLYPYEGFFAKCKENGWAYSVTFKEGCLPSVWSKMQTMKRLQVGNSRICTKYYPGAEDCKKVIKEYSWLSSIDYKGYNFNWIQYKKKRRWMETNQQGNRIEKSETSTFCYLTDLPINNDNIITAIETGRLRWKIENEGFNTLKNGGYGMQHKWSRKSYQGLKNYYQFMQMGHLINQLMSKSVAFKTEYMKEKNHPTEKAFWEVMISALGWAKVKVKKLKQIIQTRQQFILVST